MRLLPVAFGLALLAGCALPGYHFDDSGESWYGDDAATVWPGGQPASEIEYEPRIVRITPLLIRQQREERQARDLNVDVKNLMRNPELHSYRVGPGDVLQVIVYGQPELNNPMGTSSTDKSAGQLVNAEGNIYFPYAGLIHVAGMTRDQIRHELTNRLSAYILDPQVGVRVREFRSKRVFISGDIAKPCTVYITNVPLTVLRALDQCTTLVSSEKDGPFGIQAVRLIRDGEMTELSLNDLYQQTRPIPLQDGDKLIVDDSASRVFMVGEFEHQQALPYSTGGMMLGDAIADTGGINLGTADASSIYVIRGFMEPNAEGTGRKLVLHPRVFHLDASSVNALVLANNFRLQPRDVVYAAPASLVNFNRALGLLTPSLNTLFQSFLIYDRARD